MRSRILLAIDSLGSGGAERQFLNVIRHLDRRKYDYMICLTVGAGVRYEEGLGLDFPVVILKKRGRFDFSVFWQMIKVLRDFRPHMVQTWLPYSTTVVHTASFFCGVPIRQMFVRGIPLDYRRNVYHQTSFFFARIAHDILVNSPSYRPWLQGVVPSRIHLVNNGLDLKPLQAISPEDVRESRKALCEPSFEGAVIGVVANFFPEKGHGVLLRCIPDVLEAHPDTRFVLVGDGPLIEDIKSAVGQNGVIKEAVVFTGYRADAAVLIAGFDILVLPSLIEGTPNAVLEALALEKPVVATAVGGIPEVIQHGETGLLVAPNNAEQLGAAICELLASPDFRRQLGKKGRKVIEQEFSIEETVGKIEYIFTQALRKVGVV